MKKIAIKGFNSISFLIIIFFVITLLYVFYEVIHLKFDHSLSGFKNFYSIVMRYCNLYYAVILIIPIHIALNNFNAIKAERAERLKIAQGEFMLTLRKMFSYHDEIHFKFRGGSGEWVKKIPENDKTNENYAKIDSYLGLFELCNHLIKRDLLDINEFKRLYGYRLSNLFSSHEIVDRVEKEKSYWTDLIELKEKLKI